MANIALYLYDLGLVLPPAAVGVGLLMLLIPLPRKAETRQSGTVARAA